MLPDIVERVRKVVEPQAIAGDEPGAFLAVHQPARLAESENRVEHSVHVRLRLGQLHPASRELHRRCEQLAPRKPPVRLVHCLQPGDGPRHSA